VLWQQNGALAQLFRKIALADDYVPSWVAVMDIAPVGRSPVGECAKFPFRLPLLRTLASNLIGFQTPPAIPTRQRPLHRSSSKAIHEGIRARELSMDDDLD
jgi:hypothetical protein